MVKNNYNVILMAPTEILARQHFNRFLNDFKYYNIGIGLMIKKMGYYGLKGFKTTKKKGRCFKINNTRQDKYFNRNTLTFRSKFRIS
jgi:RecG-like helicase